MNNKERTIDPYNTLVIRLMKKPTLIQTVLSILVLAGLLLPHRYSNTRTGSIQVEDYTIRVLPAVLNKRTPVLSDSCVLIINDINHPTVFDTIVYHPRLGSSLSILMAKGHQWTMIDHYGDCQYSQHLFSIRFLRDEFVIPEKGVSGVIFVELIPEQACFRVSYASINGDAPYYTRTLYASRPIKKDTGIHDIATAKVGEKTIKWAHSDVYNYALISNEKDIVSDTLRWKRVHKSPYNSWHFLMVKDTIIIDNHIPQWPSCKSPLVVRDQTDLALEVLPELGKSESQEYRSSAIPVSFIQFVDKPSWSLKETIQVTTNYLNTSPTQGRIMNDLFFESRLFLRQD